MGTNLGQLTRLNLLRNPMGEAVDELIKVFRATDRIQTMCGIKKDHTLNSEWFIEEGFDIIGAKTKEAVGVSRGSWREKKSEKSEEECLRDKQEKMETYLKEDAESMLDAPTLRLFAAELQTRGRALRGVDVINLSGNHIGEPRHIPFARDAYRGEFPKECVLRRKPRKGGRTKYTCPLSDKPEAEELGSMGKAYSCVMPGSNFDLCEDTVKRTVGELPPPDIRHIEELAGAISSRWSQENSDSPGDLILSNCGFDPVGMLALADGIGNAKIRVLDISRQCWRMGPKAGARFVKLLKEPNSTIETFMFGGGPTPAKLSLKKKDDTKDKDFSEQNFGSGELAILAWWLSTPAASEVTHLDIHGNPITGGGMEEYHQEGSKSVTLTNMCALGDDFSGVEALLEALKNSEVIKHLDASNCGLGPRALCKISDALPPTLTSLDLSKNRLSSWIGTRVRWSCQDSGEDGKQRVVKLTPENVKGIEALAEKLQASNIEKLVFSQCQLRPSSIKKLDLKLKLKLVRPAPPPRAAHPRHLTHARGSMP